MPITTLCSEERVREQTPLAANVASRADNLIPRYIVQASQAIRRFCRRKFDKGDYSFYMMSPDTFNNQENYRFRLAEWPITPDTLFISYDPDGQFIDGVSMPAELTEGVDYVVDNATGWVDIISHGLTFNSRGLKVEYNGGYDLTGNLVAVPDDIATACALQVAFMLDRMMQAQIGTSSEKGNRSGNQRTFTVDAQSGLTPEVLGMLVDHRIPLIGRV